MKILFIVDPLPELKAYKDSSVAMMRGLVARGHDIHTALQGDIFLRDAKVFADATPITLVPDADLHEPGWWQAQAMETLALSSYDAVVMRKDPPFDMEYVYATHLLERAQVEGARVFNAGAAIRNHPEKLAIAEFPEYTAPTLVTRGMARLREFLAEHGDVIFKPLDGMGGTGIFRVRAGDPNLNVILEVLTDEGRRTIMAQRYIPAITEGDKRVLIIGGEPVPYVLARIPQAGETRGNLAAGGRGVAQPLREHDRAVATAIGQRLAGRGLLLIGLDMIGDYITEINVTSPTCFVEITEQTGFDVAARFAQALEAAVGSRPA
ncbi:glutathione synthase [Achromobacter sp. GG226]|uniref:glutathione synthase n=1 Tax=Verticiella alkaliphila TaxID=2779529 RepID=UPI001C0AC5BF|nr:glutathione synthase [Verticiella sp. GG226]MBU4611198.1 glutathione synthase [Verticiella sp. GG226]